MITFLLLFYRLSTEIAAVEETLPDNSKFREGHTQVSDVKKIYLTGSYKHKYRNVTANMAKSPFVVDPHNQRIYPNLEIGHRKVRSAYPNVRLKYTPTTDTPFHQNNNHPTTRALSTMTGAGGGGGGHQTPLHTTQYTK